MLCPPGDQSVLLSPEFLAVLLLFPLEKARNMFLEVEELSP